MISENILFFLLGAAGSSLGMFLYAKNKIQGARLKLQLMQEAHEKECRLKEAALQEAQTHIREMEQQKQRTETENKQLIAAFEKAHKEAELLQEQIKREEIRHEQMMEKQAAWIREQVQNSTQELLVKRSRELTENNHNQMDALLNPLKESIAEMKKAMESNRDVNNKNTASLEKAITEMMKQATDIGREADKLATALRNENKIQGNWGELILDDLLSGQGLKEGIHYDKQVTIKDGSGKIVRNEESGKRMIPDTILHYPDGKDAIIDSKVSLTAFVDYQNASNEAEKAAALKRHVDSIRQHVQELSRKDYSSYIKAPRQSLNYVIMFVPNESALQLALSQDSSLWHKAFEKGVFITSEQNLMAALRMIQITWTQVRQAQNQEQIFDAARLLLDRVADFIKFFDEVGGKLQDAQNCFLKASNKLKDGRQSIVGGAHKLIRLGAKNSTNKKLPEEQDQLPEP